MASRSLARPVVLLPGLDGTGELYAPLQSLLPGAVAIRYPDEPAADLDALVQDACPDGAVVIAESFSGPLALRLAAAHPERVHHLILVATFAHLPYPGALGSLSSALFRMPAPRSVLGALLLNGEPEILPQLTAAIAATSPATLAHRLRSCLSLDERELLPRIQVPTTVVVATRDRLVPPRITRALAAGIPDARQVDVDGPHLLCQTRPEAIAALVS